MSSRGGASDDGVRLSRDRGSNPRGRFRGSLLLRGGAKRAARMVQSGTASARWQLGQLPRDERGTISLVSVFTLMVLVILLGMVMNTCRQVDQKVKMQNAADAATAAGGTVLARNMNTLAFTNHLLSEVFALTAVMREAQARRAEQLTPEILDNWERIGRFMFGTSAYPPFQDLAQELAERIPAERAVDGDREMVFAFGQWVAAGSVLMLPVFEEILGGQMIPEFQRSLVAATPEMVQLAADEVARRHGQAWPRPVPLRAVIWDTQVQPLGLDVSGRRALPVIDAEREGLAAADPACDCTYFELARQSRRSMAEHYLDDWNNQMLKHFDQVEKISHYQTMWRIFTCGELNQLLDVEYPDSNLPHVIESQQPDGSHLMEHYLFVGVAYRDRMQDFMPRVFVNPVAGDTVAFAQGMFFVPRRRWVWLYHVPYEERGIHGGGIPGVPNPFPDPETEVGQGYWDVDRERSGWHPQRWDLLTQNWTTQLVPATVPRLNEILSTEPAVLNAPGLEPANYRGLSPEDIAWLNHH